jgi:hypothetical protein
VQRRVGLALTLAAAVSACAAPPPAQDTHVPDFAKRAYAPFSREDAIAIALREWRLFGSPVDDDPPGTHPDLGENKPERLPGLWQRVGEYWFEGLNASDPEHAWTGKHDANGAVFPPSQDDNYAWSAAFISYVMRIAGAGPGFPYAAAHNVYIDIAARQARGEISGWLVTAADPAQVAPLPGDLLCTGRGNARDLRYEDLPAGRFPGHCDIVVQDTPQGWAVIGGNVDDAVTMKHVPHDADGRIAAPDGTPYDTRTPWMVVIRVGYAA